MEYPRIFPNFENCARCEKDLKDNKDNSLHLGRKYARIFVLGHYLFLVAHSFPRAYFRAKWRLLFIYIEDVTQWREDMNSMFERQ